MTERCLSRKSIGLGLILLGLYIIIFAFLLKPSQAFSLGQGEFNCTNYTNFIANLTATQILNMGNRQLTGLRLLLLIAGIEPNPGPIDLSKVSKTEMEKILQIIHEDDPDYALPTTKRLLEAELQKESENAVKLAMKFAALETKAPTAPLSPAPSGAKPVKLPDFYFRDTKVWFEQIERLLEGLSDNEKMLHLLQILPTNVLIETGVQSTDSFDSAKNAIQKFYCDTQEHQLKKLLQQQQLGDRKPSAALRQLKNLVPDSPKLVKLRFFEILPESVRLILTSLEDVDIEKLAETADKMLEQMQPTAACVNTETPNTSACTPEMTNLQQQVEKLTCTVQTLVNSRNFNRGRNVQRNRFARGVTQRSFSRSNSQRRNLSRSREFSNNGPWCYNHFHFREKATSCKKPCSWKPNFTRSRSGNARSPSPPRQAAE